MKFYRYDTHTIMNGMVVRYRLINDLYDFEINASRDGVMIGGNSPTITDGDSLRDVNDVIGRAYRQYDNLKDGKGLYAFGSDPDCVIVHRARTIATGGYTILESREKVEQV